MFPSILQVLETFIARKISRKSSSENKTGRNTSFPIKLLEWRNLILSSKLNCLLLFVEGKRSTRTLRLAYNHFTSHKQTEKSPNNGSDFFSLSPSLWLNLPLLLGAKKFVAVIFQAFLCGFRPHTALSTSHIHNPHTFLFLQQQSIPTMTPIVYF